MIWNWKLERPDNVVADKKEKGRWCEKVFWERASQLGFKRCRKGMSSNQIRVIFVEIDIIQCDQIYAIPIFAIYLVIEDSMWDNAVCSIPVQLKSHVMLVKRQCAFVGNGSHSVCLAKCLHSSRNRQNLLKKTRQAAHFDNIALTPISKKTLIHLSSFRLCLMVGILEGKSPSTTSLMCFNCLSDKYNQTCLSRWRLAVSRLGMWVQTSAQQHPGPGVSRGKACARLHRLHCHVPNQTKNEIPSIWPKVDLDSWL